MCCCCVRLPCWVAVCEYGPDVLFVHQGDIFFGLAKCCVGECSEDTGAGFSLSGYVSSVWDERFAFVACHSECGSRGGLRCGSVVECFCGL